MMDFDGLCVYVKVHFPNSFSIGEPMKDHTTFAIGGPADLFVTVREAKALQALLKKARDCDVPYLILGKGSNMLVRDGGIRGLVVHLDEGGAQLVTGYELRAGGGVPLSQVSQLAAAHGLGGLTFAIGIPGSLGGAVLMNAGAYGGEMSDVIKEVTFLDENLDFQTAKATDLSYSYRHSYFMDHPGCVIVEAVMELWAQASCEIEAEMADFTKRRKEKQPLEYPSAGSTFKRPPGYYTGPLIRQAGLAGLVMGGAQVSKKHTGFVINREEATARDVLRLIKTIQYKVRSQYGVLLEPEVRIFGEDTDEKRGS